MKKKNRMPGLVSLDDVLAALPEEERKLVEARGAEILARVRRRMTLAEMRKGRKISQAALAETLGVGQMQISRLERRKDPRLSTIKRTVAAMGGTLTMVVTLPDQEPMVLVTEYNQQVTNDACRKAAQAPPGIPSGLKPIILLGFAYLRPWATNPYPSRQTCAAVHRVRFHHRGVGNAGGPKWFLCG